MSKNDKLKSTRTTRYLMGTSPKHGFDGSGRITAVSTHAGQPTLHRLGFNVTPKLTYEPSKLCQTIESIPDVLVFCDTNLFHHSTDASLWDVLLAKKGRMVLIPHVLEELQPWLATNSGHVAAQAISRNDPNIDFFSLADISEQEVATFAYYVNLLGFRKRLLPLRIIRFKAVHGREPDEHEVAALKREIHASYGPRGYLLANKGSSAPTSQTFYTDEALVYLAVSTGISTGRPVIILTKDEDVQEQFYKLFWLLDTQYRGMLIADLFASSPASFVTHTMPATDLAISDSFIGDSVLIERSDELIQQVLPEHFHFVPLFCWVIGEKLTEMIFGAEQEMARLLHVKGETNGLNTNRLNGKNLHLWLAPLDIPMHLRGCSAIVQDQRLKMPSSTAEIPILDVNQAVFCGERFKRTI